MDQPFGALSRGLDRFYALCLWLAAISIAVIGVLMMVQALTREFGLPQITLLGVTVRFRGIDDIVGWLCADAAVLALPAMFKRGDLVRVTLLSDHLGERARRRVELFCLAAALVFVSYMTLAFARFVRESWAFDELAQNLVKIEVWIPQFPMVVGIAGLWLAVLEDLVRALKGAKTAYQAAIEERAARQDYSESL